ncbi:MULTISPECIES: hypothetical protein [unclassified Campylobacter]|uniref:hypothetical protein n=1 Tax=unclassified Campylobacter TaxID=2593542 RepID=UPI0012381241|nr:MULTISPECIES: hypothetical protein [unclassified Campylobacter]KAA6226378.1 hypothetical protein FMM57_06235 [Campylobacter sp. LR286c]KAA6226584.1 hypothetical protein FMM54_04000 [Campylobacter sp. LR185c]KAA6226870.1 hypothetical protein FMM55_04805 [Campylobacter sp. LR196d]KAA6230307.1 hypothetical protein FMM58_06435 [Campylobacter sp. LR291e]KAA8603610.1 hypothetical protein CGP82_06360 [Campylobacter sp. LR185c]
MNQHKKRPKIAILYKKYNVEISQLLQQGNTTNQVASYLAKRDNISYTAIYFRALKINKDLKRDNNL